MSAPGRIGSVFSGDPNGSVTAAKGTIGWDETNNILYVNDDGASSWVPSAEAGVGQAFRITVPMWTEATGDQTTTPSVNIVRYYQVYVPTRVTITDMEIRPTVTTGADMELGIYADDGGVPGARLAKTAVTDLDTLGSGTHRVPLESSITLAPGWYWMAYVPTLDGPTMRGFMSFTEDGIQVDGIRAETSQSTLPATATSAATGSNVAMHLYLVS